VDCHFVAFVSADRADVAKAAATALQNSTESFVAAVYIVGFKQGSFVKGAFQTTFNYSTVTAQKPAFTATAPTYNSGTGWSIYYVGAMVLGLVVCLACGLCMRTACTSNSVGGEGQLFVDSKAFQVAPGPVGGEALLGASVLTGNWMDGEAQSPGGRSKGVSSPVKAEKRKQRKQRQAEAEQMKIVEENRGNPELDPEALAQKLLGRKQDLDRELKSATGIDFA
jgi:hypothetical protein